MYRSIKNQVISTADTVSIDPSESRQPSVPDTDTRNLIIAQQARRIQELEIEISELKRARHDAVENVIGGGVFYLALFRLRGSGGGYRGILGWHKPSNGWHYACNRRTTAMSRRIRGKRGATRRNTFGLEGAVCAAHIAGGTPTSGGARRMIAATLPR